MITPEWVALQFQDLTDVSAFPHGGQKWVFGAAHPTEGPVVIKLIKPTTDAERVRREVLAVGQVESMRVPRIHQDGVLEGTPWGGDLIWLRERQIDGRSVRQLLQEGFEFGRDEVLRLGLHVLEALADIEKARIVHRDIKPENIIRDNDGAYWLLDFGIARHLDLQSLTATEMMGGPCTPGYAPPEQYRNQKRELDGRADMFALAVTMVEVVSGVNPYRHEARDISEVIRRIERAPMPIPMVPWDKENKFKDLVATLGQRRIDCRPENASDALNWMREVAAALQA